MNASQENALHAWAVACAGVAADHVIWSDQSGPQVARPMITIKVARDMPIGIPALSVDASNPAAVLYTVQGDQRVTVNIQIFTDVATDVGSALAIASTFLIRSRLPSIREALNAAGLSIATMGGAIGLAGGVIDGAQYEPRAMIEVVFNATASASEAGNYIASVEVSQIP